MVNLHKKIVFLIFLCTGFVLIGCGEKSTSSPSVSADTQGIEKFEAAFAKEISSPLPDFSSPAFVDKNVKVEGMPEKVEWYTSNPKSIADPLTKQGGTFYGYLSEYPATMRVMGPDCYDATRNLRDSNFTLLDLNPETREFIPSLATHWAFSKDGNTCYFLLNPKATWSDGTPVTVDDYLFAYDWYTDPSYGAVQEASFLKDYKLRKITDSVLAVTYLPTRGLDKQFLLYRCYSMSPSPRHFFGGSKPKNYREAYNEKVTPRTDPYVISAKDSIKDQVLVLKKVKNWWGYCYDYNKNRYPLDRIEYRIITGGRDIALQRFYKQELDSFYAIIPSEWRSIAGNENTTKGYLDRWYANFTPVEGIEGLLLNIQDPILKDIRVREGINYALDVQGMIDHALNGEYQHRNNPIGVGHIFVNQNFDDTDYVNPSFNVEKATELFEKAGYTQVGSDGIRTNKQGTRLSLELLYNAQHWSERFSILKEQAKKAGLELVLKLQNQSYFNTVKQRHYQIAFMGMTTSLVPVYDSYFSSKSAKTTDSINFWGYSSPKMDALLASLKKPNISVADYASITRNIQKLALSQTLVVPLWLVNYSRGYAWKWVRLPYWLNRRFDDSIFDPLNGFLWIDNDLRKETLAAMSAGKEFEPKIYKLSTRYQKSK